MKSVLIVSIFTLATLSVVTVEPSEIHEDAAKKA